MIFAGAIDGGGPVLTAKRRFGANSSPGSTWTIPTDDDAGTNFVAGDICIACQLAESTTATPPSAVTPTGWTAITSAISIVGGNGNGVRLTFQYKLLTAADIGAVITGMNGTGRNRVCAMACHFNRPVQGIEVANTPIQRLLSTGVTGNIDIAWDGESGGSHLLIGVAHGQASVSDANYDWVPNPIGSAYVGSVAAPDLGTVEVTRTWYSFFPAGVDPEASTIMRLLIDTGDFNGVSGVILRLT